MELLVRCRATVSWSVCRVCIRLEYILNSNGAGPCDACSLNIAMPDDGSLRGKVLYGKAVTRLLNALPENPFYSIIHTTICFHVFPKEGCWTAYALHGTARGVWSGVLNASPSPTHDPRQFGTQARTTPNRTTPRHIAPLGLTEPTHHKSVPRHAFLRGCGGRFDHHVADRSAHLPRGRG